MRLKNPDPKYYIKSGPMKTIFQKGDKVNYGQFNGVVVDLWAKEKKVEAIFTDAAGKQFIVLFDPNGEVEQTGKFHDFPILKKGWVTPKTNHEQPKTKPAAIEPLDFG